MDALTLLKENINVVKLLEHYDFAQMSPDGLMMRACCKLHNGDNPSAFVINTETGLWYCHTGDCGGGDIFTLVQAMEDIDFIASVKFVADLFGIDITNLKIEERKEQYLEEMKAWIKVMKSRRSRGKKIYSLTELPRPVKSYRSYRQDTLDMFELGYLESVVLKKKGSDETYTLRKRLAFPLYQDGVRVGYSLRRTKADDIPKWSHQPSEIQTGKMLYNYDRVKYGLGDITVVEGILDVWAYYEIGVPAVAAFGAHLTDDQFAMLVRTGADITLSYDGDAKGRLATENALQRFRNIATVRVVHFEEGEDPDSIPREELRARYDQRTIR